MFNHGFENWLLNISPGGKLDLDGKALNIYVALLSKVWIKEQRLISTWEDKIYINMNFVFFFTFICVTLNKTQQTKANGKQHWELETTFQIFFKKK